MEVILIFTNLFIVRIEKPFIVMLKDQLKLLRKEQFNLRFQVSNGQNENPARFRLIRKEIACIKTILNNVVTTK